MNNQTKQKLYYIARSAMVCVIFYISIALFYSIIGPQKNINPLALIVYFLLIIFPLILGILSFRNYISSSVILFIVSSVYFIYILLSDYTYGKYENLQSSIINTFRMTLIFSIICFASGLVTNIIKRLIKRNKKKTVN